MAEAVLIKHLSGALYPATPVDAQELAAIKTGESVRVKWTKMRNVAFHRKFFALLTLAFESWEPEETEYKGLPVEKNFERFRKDVIIAAGYYTPVFNVKGNVRAEAKSISFAKMDENEFAQLYDRVCDVLIHRVLIRYSREDLDRVVSELMEFC